MQLRPREELPKGIDSNFVERGLIQEEARSSRGEEKFKDAAISPIRIFRLYSVSLQF